MNSELQQNKACFVAESKICDLQTIIQSAPRRTFDCTVSILRNLAPDTSYTRTTHTQSTAVKFNPHRDPAVPSPWVNTYIAGLDGRAKPVVHYIISLGVALEYLQNKCAMRMCL